jgi:hypothetical protein
MLKVFIVTSNDDKYVEYRLTIIAKSEEQALKMAATYTQKEITDLEVIESADVDQVGIVDNSIIFYGV